MNRSRSLRKPTDRPSPDDPDPRTLSPSRLPVKPLQRTASTAAPAKPSARTGLTRAASTREGSKYPPPSSRTVSSAGRDGLGRSGTGRSAEGVRRTQAGPSGERRTQEADAGRPRAGTGHVRTRSTTVLSGAPSLRPPSQPTRAQPQPTTRQPSSHARTKSSTATLPSASLRAPSQPKPQPSAPAPARRAPHLKPAFNNNQQHYSPARNTAPKPLTASFLAPPSPGKLPANVALSADTLRLQNDLLRYHVLHAASEATTASWHDSAREKLGGKFEELASESRELSAEEARLLEDINVAALRRWGGNLEEKVQGLDALLSAIWRASEPGAKHARLARRFERWAERAREAEDARGRGGILDGNEPALVGGLDDAWREECGVLRAKLEGWRVQLEGLSCVPGEGSNLEGMLRGCGELVGGMLGELGLMVEVEEAVVGREREWVRGVIGSVGDGREGTAGAIWRA